MSILDLSRSDLSGRPGSRPRRRPRPSRRRLIELERLEIRLVLSIDTWTGMGADANWSTGENWMAGTQPVAGDSLVFPDGAAQLANTDDLGAAIAFGSLTLSGSGYSISASGGSTASFTSIESSQNSGSNTVALPLSLAAATTVTVDNAASTLLWGGVISGSAALSTSGDGTLDLTANNTYTGPTTVGSGTLLVDGNQSGSAVTVNSAATLGGIGTVGSISATGATVIPGNPAPGVLIDSGGLTLTVGAGNSQSTFTAVLDGTAAGNGAGKYSQLQAGGAINLSGVTLNATLASGFVPTVGSTYTIINNTGATAISGTFQGQADGSTVQISGTPFRISYLGGASDNSVVLTAVNTSTTTLTPTPASSVSGQSVALTATVTGPAGNTTTPTGTVNFLNGTTLLGSGTLSGGTFTLHTSALPVAANSITAVYLGDTNFGSSTSPAATVTVAHASTTTVVTPSSTGSVFGQSVTLTATVAPASPGAGTPTGTVQFFSGTTSLGTENLSLGTASLSTTSLPVAANSITAVYSGDTNFTTSTSTAATVTTAQASTTTSVTVSPFSPVVGQTVMLAVAVVPVSPGVGTATGTIKFFSGSTLLGESSLSGGLATFSTTAIPAGVNSVTAQYTGDTNFSGSTSPAVSVTVAPTATSTTTLLFSPTTPVFGENVSLSATVLPVGTGSPTGTVQFFNGTTSLGTATILGSVATLNTSALPIAANSITAVYSGDSTFTSSISAPVTVTVTQGFSSSTVTFFPTSPVVAQNVTLTAAVAATSPATGTPTGSVEFFNGATSLGTGTISGGIAMIETSALATGGNSITAHYSGDSNFTSSISPAVTVTVADTATTTTTVTFSPTTPAPVAGQSVALTATVAPVGTGSPTGTVEFFNGTTLLGTQTLTGGVATLNTTTLPVAANSITAVYSGDSSFTSSVSPLVTVTVAQASSTTAVTSSPPTPLLGQVVTLTATVAPVSPGAGTPTGTVQFFSGTTPLGSGTLSAGVATIETSSLLAGANSITASYAGDTNFSSSTSPAVTVNVAATANSTTTVTFSPSAPVFGATVTLTATVAPVGSGSPTGTVQFFNGSTSLGTQTLTGGVATLNISTLPIAANSITAKYSGDTNFTQSTSPAVTVTVTQASTTTVVTFSPTTPSLGQTVTLTATVVVASPGAGTPTGTVQFFNGTTSLGTGTLSAGTARITTSSLPVGSASITATYSGDANFVASTSTAATVTIAQASTTTSLTVSNTSPGAFDTVTLSATVAAVSPAVGTPTGTVEFLADGSSLGTATLSAGQATLSVVLPIGTDSVTAQYSGDSNFAFSTSSAVTATVGTAIEQYINQVYLIELFRSPTSSDLAFWDKQFAQGLTRKQFVASVATSPEAKLALVQSIFDQYLGLDGTPAQVAYAVNEAARTHTSVQAVVLGSHAFIMQSGGTLGDFLSALQTAVLGYVQYQPVLAEQLARGVSPVKVAEEVLQSNIGKSALLKSSFENVLARDPTTAENVAYVQLMDQGILLRQIIASLLAGAEFFKNSTSTTSTSST
jgi:trimeric autotransporter adhesin